MTPAVLTLDKVTKCFDRRPAVDAVSFALAEGERIALLGHNGAGKTTLFKMILGFLRPDTGALAVFGARPGTAAARTAIAYLPEAVAFHKSLTGEEVLRYYARLKGEDATRAVSLLDRVGLAEAGRRRVGTYSKGMRQRLGLAQALIGRPRLVLLDEPTSGLDPISRQNFYEIVEEVAARGATVLLSSHALTEVEAKTDRILILSHGRLVADDTLSRLRAQARLPIRLKVQGTEETAAEIAERLGGRRLNGRSVELLCDPSDKVARLAAITALGSMVADVDVTLPSLDDIYRHFSGVAPKED
ncbi:ABC transporter ATP-binding protein [Polymorphum gilvum]|uniref:ABC transporter, ATP-binding protein NosF n=1 Tax=Polymorphum gilvum (strain LMG 25793 / CGMCC 1.9160 / SL003B-26A1) TaxID=991905 RepID=F2J4Q3_POLGS|nr:ABC transporter ATP-binding protein [Polymorphum gilvum]ADZ68995.1 ABC transporter, ATP-binding protein NosF [Polymorphum gilvum SL003B-26A1]